MSTRTVFTPQRYVPGRQKNEWVTYLKDGHDPPGLVVKKVNENIGKGVFTTKKIPYGSFILEYDGELISKEEAEKREISYPAEYGSFLLYFKSGRTVMCVDATFSKQIGRYVNDGIGFERNADLKIIFIDKKPHIVLFSTRNICKGEEIRFDYGVQDLPWRQQQTQTAPKSTHLITKECTVLLEKCDLSKPFWQEKEDGTYVEILCSNNQFQQIKQADATERFESDADCVAEIRDKKGPAVINTHHDEVINHHMEIEETTSVAVPLMYAIFTHNGKQIYYGYVPVGQYHFAIGMISKGDAVKVTTLPK